MELKVTPARRLEGEVILPGDKSISHRAALIGSLAEGKTVIYNYAMGRDCLSTLACLRQLGVEITLSENGTVCINGHGPDGLKEPADVLDAGNSGTTMRLLAGILAGRPFFSVLTGDSSLRRRPMRRIAEPLVLMGASVDGRANGSYPPLALRGGPLKAIEYASQVASAQVKSAVLLAALQASGKTVYKEPCRSRDHTERMLLFFGAGLCAGDNWVSIEGGQALEGRVVRVPGDISSAAFFMAAAAVLPGSRLVFKDLGLNPTRTGFLEVLEEMGAGVEILARREEGGEPVGDVSVFYRRRPRGVKVGGGLIPRLIDEIPALCVVAAVAEGITEIRDAAELKVKESDRLASVAALLSAFGALVEELPEGIIVRGVKELRGTACQSFGDHRLAMAAAVAGLVADGETVVQGAECMDVSFPNFAQVLNELRAG